MPNVEHRTSNIEGRVKFRNSFGGAFVAITAVSSLIMGGSRVTAAQSDASHPAEIRAVMTAQVAAWNRGDIDGFMAGYARSDATEFVSGDKITRGWQTVRDNYRKKYNTREKMGALTFSDIKVTLLSSNAAIVLGRWQLVRKNDKPHGTFTLLFRRTPADWRIVYDHTS